MDGDLEVFTNMGKRVNGSGYRMSIPYVDVFIMNIIEQLTKGGTVGTLVVPSF